MTTPRLTSATHDVDDLDAAIELCYERGWTDGLPVVPPTEAKVLRFLEASTLAPADIIGVVPMRGRVITAEKVAVNAVMAGCKPEYMPVVVAAIEAVCDDTFNVHGTSASTGGAAVLVIVNGPVRHALGLNSRANVFGPGPGFRANATIGRAVRLVLQNVLGATPDDLDRSTFGHPGKFTYCVAEDEEDSPWEPLHVERGFKPHDSTVTCVAAMAPWQVSNRSGDSVETVLNTLADTMNGGQPLAEEIWALIGWEHRLPIKASRWTKQQVKDYLKAKATRPTRAWAEAGKVDDPAPGRENEPMPAVRPSGRVELLAAGGHAGVWSCVVPVWNGGYRIRSVTRKIAAGAKS